MSTTADTITLPSHWASFLINGDASGLDDGEQERIEAHLKGVPGHIVGVEEGSERFTWCYAMYGGDARGGGVADYTILRDS
ncbi:hypothetical protein [Methylobacterium marchantiae]|uniref:Uncharacterized protein n=1 Tax=Methylobacterium marchantiae TaxID=600331 RepID=A0ABW3X1P2_9HYPH|nr:hypothetical protein AIGOOFII_3473 [Methylobacterium marchantiae]